MRKFYFLALLLLGLFLMPSDAFACGSKIENQRSTTEMPSNKCKKDCCDANSHRKNKKQHSCNGNCKNSKCICTTSCGIFLAFIETALKTNSYDFYNKNQKFNNPGTFISSGFFSLWLKPKIG